MSYCTSFQEHALPQQRYTPSTGEILHIKVEFAQHVFQRSARKELDVTPVPKDGEVRVKPARNGKDDVFQVPVIRSGQNNSPASGQNRSGEADQASGIVKVLNDLGADDNLEAFGSQFWWEGA